MAYSTEANALARIASMTHGAATLKGPLGCRIITSVRRNPIRDGSRLSAAVARPVAVGGLDQQVIARFLDHASAIAYSTAAAAFTVNLTTAAGGSASIVTGTCVPGTIEDEGEVVEGGFPCQQVFEMEATDITRTVTQ